MTSIDETENKGHREELCDACAAGGRIRRGARCWRSVEGFRRRRRCRFTPGADTRWRCIGGRDCDDPLGVERLPCPRPVARLLCVGIVGNSATRGVLGERCDQRPKFRSRRPGALSRRDCWVRICSSLTRAPGSLARSGATLAARRLGGFPLTACRVGTRLIVDEQDTRERQESRH